MKKLLAGSAAMILSMVCYGQGQVQFENFTINAPFTYGQAVGFGPEARAQLFLPDGTALGTPQPFEASAPGYFFAGIVDVPGVPPGASQIFVVRAWFGDSWASASLRTEVVSGTVTVGGEQFPPLTVPFEAVNIPEPGTMALAIVGAAGLFLRRVSLRRRG